MLKHIFLPLFELDTTLFFLHKLIHIINPLKFLNAYNLSLNLLSLSYPHLFDTSSDKISLNLSEASTFKVMGELSFHS